MLAPEGPETPVNGRSDRKISTQNRRLNATKQWTAGIHRLMRKPLSQVEAHIWQLYFSRANIPSRDSQYLRLHSRFGSSNLVPRTFFRLCAPRRGAILATDLAISVGLASDYYH